MTNAWVIVCVHLYLYTEIHRDLYTLVVILFKKTGDSIYCPADIHCTSTYMQLLSTHPCIYIHATSIHPSIHTSTYMQLLSIHTYIYIHATSIHPSSTYMQLLSTHPYIYIHATSIHPSIHTHTHTPHITHTIHTQRYLHCIEEENRYGGTGEEDSKDEERLSPPCIREGSQQRCREKRKNAL